MHTNRRSAALLGAGQESGLVVPGDGRSKFRCAIIRFLCVAPLLLSIGLGITGCRHTSASSDKAGAKAPWQGFGQPGPNKIEIVVAGDVENPGRYYLDVGVSLESIPDIVGGLVKCRTCGKTPQFAHVVRQSVKEGKRENYRLRQMTTKQLKAVQIQDGDRHLGLFPEWHIQCGSYCLCPYLPT